VSREGLTLRQFGVMGRRGVPGGHSPPRSSSNVVVLLLIDDTPAIIAPGNCAPSRAHVLALSAFVLLRRDRAEAARPIRLPSGSRSSRAGASSTPRVSSERECRLSVAGRRSGDAWRRTRQRSVAQTSYLRPVRETRTTPWRRLALGAIAGKSRYTTTVRL